MHNLTPTFILQQYDKGVRHGRLQAATLFLDISGFTAVTEALMQHGKAGAEALSEVMQAIFTPLIETVYEQGGFISGFAGDAFTAVFPGRGIQARARAIKTAWELRRLLAENPTYDTPYGPFDFTGKVGLAAGLVRWGILGEGDTLSYYFRGAAIDNCAAAEHLAAGDDVVIQAKMANSMADYLSVVPLPKSSYALLLDIKHKLPIGRPSFFTQSAAEQALLFQPELLVHNKIRGEFRQVVSVFINVKGSPRSKSLAAFMRTIHSLLHQYGGYLCRLDFGDKGCNLLLFWGAPTSHENDIERALNFLLALKEATDLTLRAGVTYRQVFSGYAGSGRREEYTCYGLSVNLAARQMMAAEWNEVWLDKESARRVLTLFNLKEVGQFPFKGFSQPQPVFALLGRQDTAVSFFDGEFFGREREMARLNAQFERVAQGHFGGLILATGEAGIGKSRFVHEALQALPADWQIFICQSDEILRQPFNPFRYWLNRYFRQSSTQSDDENKAQFDAQLAQLKTAVGPNSWVAELDRTRSFLGALINLEWPNSLYEQLEPELRLENTLRALKTLLRVESLRQPVVLVVEDLQWLDEASGSFLLRLPRNMEQFPMVMIGTSRNREDVSIFDAEPRLLHIHIEGLDTAVINAKAAAFLGTMPSPDLAQFLHTRAEGNPFFLEQLLLYLQENELLVASSEGMTLQSKLETLPTDVNAVLVARLDRLTQTVRDVVQTAAVLGREFEVTILAQMLKDFGTVDSHIKQAEEAAVWSAISELTYLFRHALLRDAAYQMQLQTRLRQLHLSAATAMEQLYSENLSAYAQEIGYHFQQADDVEAAIPYWRQAAAAAQANYQNEVAITLLEQILTYQNYLSFEEKIELWQQQAAVYTFTGNFEAADSTLQQALEHAKNETAVPFMGRILNSMGELNHYRGEFKQAEQVLRQSLTLLENIDDQRALIKTYRELGNAQEGIGNYDQALAYYQKSMAASLNLNDLRGQAQANLNIGLIVWNKGDYDEAERLYKLALTSFEQLGDVYSAGKVYNNLGSVAWSRKDMELARHYFEQSYAIMLKCGSYLGQSITLGNLGSVNFFLKDYDQATRLNQESFEISREANDLYGMSFSQRNLSDSLWESGQHEVSWKNLKDALETAVSIEADAIVLDIFLSISARLVTTDPHRAYLLLLAVKRHPAHYEEMLWRASLTEEKLTNLTRSEKNQLETEVTHWSHQQLVESITALELANY